MSVEAPPALNAEAFQVGKILAALQAEPGLVVDVATAGPLPTAFHQKAGAQVITVPCRLRRWQRCLLRAMAPWVAHRPDWWFLFAWRWRVVARQLDQPPQLIYSRSFPLSSTLAAYKLARHFGVPWFLHLSDPWCESSLPKELLTSRWHQRREVRCLQRAQRISFTSATTLHRYQKRYPHLMERMVLDPNTYTTSQVNQQPWQPTSRFRLVHTGSFTQDRWPDVLFQALNALPADHLLLQELSLIHAGPVDGHARKLFDQAGGWLEDHGPVPASVAHGLQLQADVLLVVDYHLGNAWDAQYLPSKLIDYIAIRRPVLAITDRDSASWQFVQANMLGVAIDHGDPAGFITALIDYWKAWRQRHHTRFELPPLSSVYSADEVAIRLANAAKDVVRATKSLNV